MTRWLIVAAAGLMVAVAAVLAFPLGPTLRFAHRQGVYGPAFGLDGNAVYFVERDSWGLWYADLAPVWTPFGDGQPVTSLVFSDHVSLRRVDRRRHSLELIEDWPATPITWRLHRGHFAAIFGHLRAVLKVGEAHGVEYVVSLDGPGRRGTRYALSRRWDESRQAVVQHAQWRESASGAVGTSSPVLSGDWELFTLRGEPAFPAAIVAFDHVTDAVEELIRVGAAPRDPREASSAHLRQRSQRAEIERREALDRARDELRRYFSGFGLGEAEVHARVTRELQRRGLMPREDALVAEPLSGAAAKGAEPPLFEISETELASGIFEDIRLAIAAPGVPVRGPRRDYLVYRGFTTSERLNAFLAAGGEAFRVGYDGRVYLLRLVRDGYPPPAGPETVTARPARADEVTLPGGLVIDLAPDAATAARYPDLIAALVRPGTLVAKRAEPYAMAGADDWATQQLNGYLFDGNKRLRARFRGRLYTLSIEAAKE